LKDEHGNHQHHRQHRPAQLDKLENQVQRAYMADARCVAFLRPSVILELIPLARRSLTSGAPAGHVVDIDRNCNESIINVALEPGTAIYLAAPVHDSTAPSESPMEYRTCCDHPDCTTCAGRGGFYRMSAGAAAKTDHAPTITEDMIQAGIAALTLTAQAAPNAELAVTTLYRAMHAASAAGAGSEQPCMDEDWYSAEDGEAYTHPTYGPGVFFTEDCARAPATQQAGAAAPSREDAPMDVATLWEIHGVVKNAGSTRLAHKIADYIAALVRAPLPAHPVQDGEKDAQLRAVVEEAAAVLESAAKHNGKQGRTVFAHEQQDRANRLRAAMAAAQQDAKGETP
jgi:hypothetical protein